MALGTGTSLPYLFSTQACAPLRTLGNVASAASEFFDTFDTFPSRGTLLFPRSRGALEVERVEFSPETAADYAESMQVLFDSLEKVLQGRESNPPSRLPFSGSLWKVVNLEFRGGNDPFLRSVMLVGPLGKVMDLQRVHRKAPCRMEIGWAASGLSVLQNLISVRGKGGLWWELGLFMEFKDCALLSLRDYLGLCAGEEEEWFIEALRPLTRHSKLQLHFGEDELSLELAMPPGATFAEISPRLETVWNFGETLVHYKHSPISGDALVS